MGERDDINDDDTNDDDTNDADKTKTIIYISISFKL